MTIGDWDGDGDVSLGEGMVTGALIGAALDGPPPSDDNGDNGGGGCGGGCAEVGCLVLYIAFFLLIAYCIVRVFLIFLF